MIKLRAARPFLLGALAYLVLLSACTTLPPPEIAADQSTTVATPPLAPEAEQVTEASASPPPPEVAPTDDPTKDLPVVAPVEEPPPAAPVWSAVAMERLVPPELGQIQRERLRQTLLNRPLHLARLPQEEIARQIVTERLSRLSGVTTRPAGSLEEPFFELRVTTAGWGEQNFDNFYGQATITYQVFDPIEQRIMAQRAISGPPVFSRLSSHDALLNSVRHALSASEPPVKELLEAVLAQAEARGLAYHVTLPPDAPELETILAALNRLGDWNGLILRTLLTPTQLFTTLRSFLSESGYLLFFDFGARKVEIRLAG